MKYKLIIEATVYLSQASSIVACVVVCPHGSYSYVTQSYTDGENVGTTRTLCDDLASAYALMVVFMDSMLDANGFTPQEVEEAITL